MIIKKILSGFIIFSFSFSAQVFSQRVPPWQNPDYGADSLSRLECAQNLSTLSEFMKINLPDYALNSWQKVFANCPSSSKNIYLFGNRIFTLKVEKEADPVLRAAYLDTLMLIYDRRIEYFGEEGLVLGRKGIDILKYGDSEAYIKAYPLFKKSAEVSGSETETNVIIGLSETGLAMYKNDKIGIMEFLGNYVILTDILALQMNDTRMRGRAGMASERVEANLASAGIDNCEEIEKVFRTRIEKSPEDIKLLNTVSQLLLNAGCEKDVFYKDVFLRVFENKPSSENAAELSKHYVKNDDYPNAVGYFIKSYELEENLEKKAQYALQVSILYYSKLGKYKEAAEYSLLALKLRPDWAEPYFAIVPAYIEGYKQCAADAFEKNTVYWLAVDLMEKAAQADPSSAEKSRSQAAEYRKFFPSKEEAFFRGIQDGSSYTIGCWINQTTRVRFNQ